MLDFKKEFKNEYNPKEKPEIISIPKSNYLAVRGKGNPNDENGEYATSISLLYPIAYALKMSYKNDYKIEGFKEYVVPLLEGFWWIEGLNGMDYNRKDELNFISLLRLPNFITKKDFEWAIIETTKKKKNDFSKIEFLTYDELEVVQIMHIGPYDEEPRSVDKMHEYIKGKGYELDFSNRYHHEIYLSDPRKTEVSKLKTIIRHPVKKIK